MAGEERTATSIVPDVEAPSVLVVDDVDANLVAMDASLADMGCRLVLARSGNDALRHLLRREFAVILLDVQMPGMDGYEVARHARDNHVTAQTPIIFVTATHDTEEASRRGYGSGAVDFLFKPIDAFVLRSKVRVFLDLYAGKRRIADAFRAIERSNAALTQLVEAKAELAERLRCQHGELQAAYRELQTTQTQLVQAAKMASLGQLVAGIAHEINNPLAFSLSHLGTVERSLDQARAEVSGASATALPHWQRITDRLREMRGGLERIRDLVLKLRTFSRLDEGECAKLGVPECIDSLLTLFGHRLRDRVRVRVRVGEPREIECSAGLFNQAVANLISNALDAMDGQGTLDIDAGRAGDAYAICVSDSGPGIPEELRERVFEPFFTTKQVGSGTGLGLSIAYSIVRKHGGTIAIGRADAGGASVTLRIPLTSHEETHA